MIPDTQGAGKRGLRPSSTWLFVRLLWGSRAGVVTVTDPVAVNYAV